MAQSSFPHRGVLAALAVLLAATVFVALQFGRRPPTDSPSPAPQRSAPKAAGNRSEGRAPSSSGRTTLASASQARPPEVVVGEKLTRFTNSRQAMVQALAASNHMAVPPLMTSFFAAVEARDWGRIGELAQAVQESSPPDPSQERAWLLMKQAAKETQGVAESVHNWPAGRLLQYGETILDTLKPGMVYVGGTDGGRFIPTLLNETTDGERHVVLTQNALADASYLQYLQYQYDGQLSLLSSSDSQKCFQEYLTDAQGRASHDQDSPSEPPQLRPGESVQITDGRVRVSGQTTVMAINERLLAKLQAKNPDLSFALEESFSLPSTYEGALPRGPLLELRAATHDNPLNEARAAESLEYWRNVQQEVATEDPSSELRKSYAKMAVAQANLFNQHGLAAAAEQGYRLARELAPTLPEAVFSLASLLSQQGHVAEAQELLQAHGAGKSAPADK